MHHVLSLLELSRDDINRVLDTAAELKAEQSEGPRRARFGGAVAALLFEKPSLRTRVSFETALAHLGGHSMYLGADVGWGKREAPQDFARVLGSYVDVIICRAFQHGRVEELARHAKAAVINGLTDTFHPCQALADLFTLREQRGELSGLKLAYVGDANNVARSLAACCGHVGVDFTIAAPPDYQFSKVFLEQVHKALPGARIEMEADPRRAVADAACVYTDVWTSMGQEAEHAQRLAAFKAFQVDTDLMKVAPKDAVFMHCLPAHRGVEVTDEVLDGPQSVVFQQAENRMHVQKGLLACILADRGM